MRFALAAALLITLAYGATTQGLHNAIPVGGGLAAHSCVANRC